MGREFDTVNYNCKLSIQVQCPSQSINVILKIEDYANKLYNEVFLKSSLSCTTTANDLKEYLKKKDICLLFSDLTMEFPIACIKNKFPNLVELSL